MTLGKHTTWLRCPICYARGKAVWNEDSNARDARYRGIADLSRGFRFVDRGRLYGSHFVCTVCNTVAKEY